MNETKENEKNEDFEIDFEIDFEMEMSDNISLLDHVHYGRIPTPENNNQLGIFTVYQPSLPEMLKRAYKGLVDVWLKQGKDPIKELEKLNKRK